MLQSTTKTIEELRREVARRRTFAIISHPDAGKTTLTEKFLLYAGAIEMAGAVRARKSQRHATSDWMAMEQERGISITASALEMEYNGYRINLLDTPGHQDFSEDTYRTLMAADSAVMVLDAAKGIEPQTLKLFEVCRMRGTPILTFINKMDHQAKEPLELLDEIEKTLGIIPVPINWPIGNGPDFQGVYDLQGRRVLRFQRTEHNQTKAPVFISELSDPALQDFVGDYAYKQLCDEVELLGAGEPLDRQRFLNGDLTPVFFGSALNNFGVEPFLAALLELAPAPSARKTDAGVVEPVREGFSGFIFKVQSNMDPRHRDRVAFMRVCSGRFQKDMVVFHTRLGKEVRMSRAYRLFARDREIIEEAYPGDVVGVVSPGNFAIGDTLTSGERLQYEPLPKFATEQFAALRNRDIAKFKQFNSGLQELEEEGAIQVLYPTDSLRRDPVLAAVGELQFDVVLSRLRAEYKVDAAIERMTYTTARWLSGDPTAIANIAWPSRGTMLCQDRNGKPVALFSSTWELDFTRRQNPKVEFKEIG